MQFEVKVEAPDPVRAKQIQEALGGQFEEMTVMMQYLFQGWNCRGEEKYKDLLMGIGTEEIGHVEMLCHLIFQLLDGTSAETQENAAQDPVTAAIMGGVNPQHLIVSGLGATPTNSIARDRYHQYQWLAAIEELENKKGLIVPASFKPEHELEAQKHAYEFYNLQEGSGARGNRRIYRPRPSRACGRDGDTAAPSRFAA